MTQGAFIEFLNDNDCDLVKEEKFYKIVRRSDRKYRAVMPVKNNDHRVRPMTICNICTDLNLEPPHDHTEDAKILKKIKDSIKRENGKAQ